MSKQGRYRSDSPKSTLIGLHCLQYGYTQSFSAREFSDLLFASHGIKTLPKKGSTLKRKATASSVANSSLKELTPS